MDSELVLHRTFTEEHMGRAGHINIQHYAQLISDATEALLLTSARGSALPMFAAQETVRFFSELHPGDEVEVKAAYGVTNDKHVPVVGKLVRTDDRLVVAKFQRSMMPWDTELQKICDWTVLPTGNDANLSEILAPIEVDSVGPVLNEFQAMIAPKDDDRNQIASPRALWHVITEALWDVQTKLGAGQKVLKNKGITGGATMFQLAHERPVPCGEMLLVATSPIGMSNSSVRMQHEIRNRANGVLYLKARYVLTFFSRNDGKRFALSEVFPDQSFYA